MSDRDWATAVGLAGGLALDALLADPRRGHPVAAFGSLAARAEDRVYRDSRPAGAGYALGLSGGAAVLGLALSRPVRRPGGLAAVTAVATWAVVGGTTLRREAHAMHALLDTGDVEAARARLP
ncbi:MAG TPA: cobalamin biosynthesis protein, partial [Nonomuraea sp.]|nr:cobalamin biosynthesis protein [Nonomuraea sp.]